MRIRYLVSSLLPSNQLLYSIKSSTSSSSSSFSSFVRFYISSHSRFVRSIKSFRSISSSVLSRNMSTSTTVSSSSSSSSTIGNQSKGITSSSSSLVYMAPEMDLITDTANSKKSTTIPNLREIPYPRSNSSSSGPSSSSSSSSLTSTTPSSSSSSSSASIYGTVPPDIQTITEGGAIALYSKGKVFYNQVQIFNRDVSIMAIRTWDQRKCESATPKEIRRAWAIRQSKPSSSVSTTTTNNSSNSLIPSVTRTTLPPLRILEALGASGLRSVRYAKEIPLERLDQIVINDIEAAAIKTIQNNIEFNQLHLLRNQHNKPLIYPNAGDASLVMYLASRGIALPGMEWMTTMGVSKTYNNSTDPNNSNNNTSSVVMGAIPQTPYLFDVIDLDPYGTASPFLDSAVQAIGEGGLLCITCTDMAVLAGNNMDVCHSKYGSIPVRGRHFAEQALRIVLSCVENHANKYKRTIKPLLSIAVDFYVRIFVTVHTSPLACNEAPTKLGYLHQCSGCDSFWLLPKGKGAGYGKGFRNSVLSSDISPVGDDSIADDHPTEQDGTNPSKRPRMNESTTFSSSTTNGNKNSSKKMEESSSFHERIHANVINKDLSHCPHCHRSVQLAGPLWIDPIHDPDFTKRTLSLMEQSFGIDGMGGNNEDSTSSNPFSPSSSFYNLSPSLTISRPSCDGGSNDVQTVAHSRRRLMGILRSIVEEDINIPLYYDLGMLASRIKSTGLPLIMAQSALLNAGYRVSGAHCLPNALKTNAPPEFIWKMISQWFAEQPMNSKTEELMKNIESNGSSNPYDTIQSTIIRTTRSTADQYPSIQWILPLTLQSSIQQKKELKAQGINISKFVSNPQAHWGPKARAHGSQATEKK